MSTKIDAAHAGLSSASDEGTEWRVEQLVRHGFSESLAEALAHDCRFDFHRLIELVERGCPPRLAARILAPTGDEKGAC